MESHAKDSEHSKELTPKEKIFFLAEAVSIMVAVYKTVKQLLETANSLVKSAEKTLEKILTTVKGEDKSEAEPTSAEVDNSTYSRGAVDNSTIQHIDE